MITFLIGTIENMGAETLDINVNGVGYQVFCPSRTLGACSHGQQVKLLTHHHIREDTQTLFGFIEESDRMMFKQLIQINGVGPKVGLSILSTLQPTQIADAVATQSGKMMAQANGVGPKLGERIVLELKGKLGTLPTATGGVVTPMAGGAASDVFSALTNMGFKEQQAQQAVASASQQMPEATFDALLKTALQHLR